MMDKLGELLQDLQLMPTADAQELLTSYVYTAAFAIGQRVQVDEDKSITFVVTSLKWAGTTPLYGVEWFSNGDAKSMYVEEWRMSLASGEPPRTEAGAPQAGESAPERPQVLGFVGGART